MNQISQNDNPSGLSIAALVTGILGMSFVPVILGSIDLVRIKNGLSSSKGKGFDIAGIVLGALVIVIGIIIVILAVIIAISIGSKGTIFGIPIESFL